MKRAFAKVLILGALTALLPLAWAQERPSPQSAGTSRASPRPDELEPGVDTSAMDRDAAAPAPAAPRSDAEAKAQMAAQASPAATPSVKPGKAEPRKTGDKAGDGKAQDRLQLDATEITGNRELPKVMYIVPWKRSDLGELASKPMNSLVDEVLEPIDRDVFKRQTHYYDALKPDQGRPAEAVPAPATSESH
jgi:hypothetical protein